MNDIINMGNDNILVFRTSVSEIGDLKKIEILFMPYPQIYKWSVDLENWEKILRIECRGIIAAEIIDVLRTIDIHASELE